MSETSKADKLLNVIVEHWKKQGFSESKIEVGLQRGSLKKMLSKVSDESLSLIDRSIAYVAAEDGVLAMTELLLRQDEQWAQKVIAEWRKEAEVVNAKTIKETASSTNASWQHDDRSAVLEFPPFEPATDVSQVGSS